MQELMGPILEQLLGPQPAKHPLLDAAALRQSPPQLVVVVVGAKAHPHYLFCAGVSVNSRAKGHSWLYRVLSLRDLQVKA